MRKSESNKTAAVYDRWLYTLGGGEQVAFAYAEILRDMGYKTDLLTHKPVDIRKAEEKMAVDLKGITVRYLPLVPSVELSGETEKYDVFINTSYMDYFPNLSKKGILSVFFPAQIHLNLWDYLKIALVLPSLKNFFIYPLDFSGFRFDEKREGKIFKWLGEEVRLVFNRPVGEIQIDLFYRDFMFSEVERLRFFVNNQSVEPEEHTLDHTRNTVRFTFRLERTAPQVFRIQRPSGSQQETALVSLTVPGWRYFIYNLFKRCLPRLEMRLHGGPEFTKRADLESYDRIVAISEYVRHWIREYWHLDSIVLYPPVSVEKFQPEKRKKNYILHIGRFFVTGHSKKQLEMAKVFTEMVGEGLEGWELHFIGSVHEGEKHQQYFNEVVDVSSGYPIHFHTDIGAAELRALLGQGKIYWHATGLDEDENSRPVLLEHFGITTVEAMASGCVPVVIAKGGQKEIVTPESGFLWNTRDELKAYTLRLANEGELWSRLSEGAVRQSKRFSRQRFERELKTLITSR